MNEKVYPLKNLLKKANISLHPIGVNKALLKIGLIEEVFYQSTTGSGKTKSFFALTKQGLTYGKNKWTPHEFKTSPRYYEETFPELMSLVAQQIAAEINHYMSNFAEGSL